MTSLTFDQACEAITLSRTANAYAKAYAKAGIGMVGEEARVQALYILNNITHWRDPGAKEVRATLKRVGGVK